MISNTNTWQSANLQDFWGEIAPSDHLVQVYENKKVFLNTLEGFTGTGLIAGDAVIIIGMPDHVAQLNARLRIQNLDVDALITAGQYLPLDVETVLSKFMVEGWPNEKLFIKTIEEIYQKAKAGSRRVRAFGEMVAFLWQQKNYSATVHLEHLWNKFCAKHSMCLYCAYPKTGFTKNQAEGIKDICCAHGKIISGSAESPTSIRFQNMDPDDGQNFTPSH